jgi:hypothetical protein
MEDASGKTRILTAFRSTTTPAVNGSILYILVILSRYKNSDNDWTICQVSGVDDLA